MIRKDAYRLDTWHGYVCVDVKKNEDEDDNEYGYYGSNVLSSTKHVGIRLSGCNLNRLISSLVRNVHGCMCVGLFILVIDNCRCDCIGTLICRDSVVDTRRICCEHVVHDVDTLSTRCRQAVKLYRYCIAFRMPL